MSELLDRPGGAACSDFGAGAGILNDSALPSPWLLWLVWMICCGAMWTEDLSVNIRGWFGSCGGWTLLLILLYLTWIVKRT